jgi:hypothetical protein
MSTICDDAELALPVKNNIDGCNTSTTTNFVIRMFVNPFARKSRRVTPTYYLNVLPQSAKLINSDNNDQQRQEWTDIWQRIKSIDTSIPESFIITSDEKVIASIIVMVTLFPLFAVFSDTDIFTLYFITLILVNVYCCVKQSERNQFIFRYLRTILVIAFFIMIVAHLAIIDPMEHFTWTMIFWILLLMGTITTLKINCIQSCIVWVDIYRRYLARQDKVLRKVYYEIKNISEELTYYTLQPKIGFHFSNIAVDVFKKELWIVSLTSNRQQVEKSPNISDFGMDDALLS